MQLGEWVEFQVIVGKQATSNGSVPMCQPIRRARKGMIVGMRNVYEVTIGSPPQLDNPQPVLIVAVSLHRTYRVYPQDAQPVAPPSPRRRRATSAQRVPAAIAGSNLPAAPSAGLDPVDDDDLAMLVADPGGELIGHQHGQIIVVNWVQTSRWGCRQIAAGDGGRGGAAAAGDPLGGWRSHRLGVLRVDPVGAVQRHRHDQHRLRVI